MKLVRTFHPVGHGAFYTEQFYEKDDAKQENSVFTAVYDCGGEPTGGLRSYIDYYFNDQKIDALFISHLHHDHISGVRHIISRCGKVFLPEITKRQKLALLVQNIIAATDKLNAQPADVIDTDDALWVIKHFYGLERTDSYFTAKLVEIPTVSSNASGVEFDSDRIKANAKYPVECSEKLEPGQAIKVNEQLNWMYYPVNIKHDIEIDFGEPFNSVVDDKTGCIRFNVLKDVCNSNEVWDAVVKKYKDYIRSSVANEYSMTVYSGVVDIPVKGILKSSRCNDTCEIRKSKGCWDCKLYNNASCMYMGDFIANDKNTPVLIEKYGNCFERASLIQVPHHGSGKVGEGQEYDYSIFNHRKEAIMSLKFGKYPGIPSDCLITKIFENGATPLIVTEEPCTKLKREYTV